MSRYRMRPHAKPPSPLHSGRSCVQQLKDIFAMISLALWLSKRFISQPCTRTYCLCISYVLEAHLDSNKWEYSPAKDANSSTVTTIEMCCKHSRHDVIPSMDSPSKECTCIRQSIVVHTTIDNPTAAQRGWRYTRCA